MSFLQVFIVALLRLEHDTTFCAEETSSGMSHHVVFVRGVAYESLLAVFAPIFVISCKQGASVKIPLQIKKAIIVIN